MEFYIIKDDGITLSNKLTHEDIVFILDGKVGYIWKGKNAKNLDELTARRIEQQIKDKFEDINFELIIDLNLKDDNPKISQIKSEISSRLPNPILIKLKDIKLKIITKFKEKISNFKNYENSREWRKKLSNLTNLWKLSIVNVIIIMLSLIFMFYSTMFHFYIGDYFLLISFIFLTSILIINLIFIIFPMKLKLTKILNINSEDDERKLIKKKQLPSKPKLPQMKKYDFDKGSKLAQKPLIKQIELEALKIPAKKLIAKKGEKKESIEGAEYSSEEDMELGIPKIPEAPKKKEKITIESPGLSTNLLEKIKKMESEEIQVVLVNCERCSEVIPVPVPKIKIINSELPVVPISYVHNNPKGKDQHNIIIYLDHDFDIRRQRISDVILPID
ncbi:MAG: hypothetical protein ACTSPD_12235 [Promethearchaeota archaeon]